MQEQVNHPQHYGGTDSPYEAIKVIERYELNFHLGNALKYILRAEKKGNKIQDLNKALWYLKRVNCDNIEELRNIDELHWTDICVNNNVDIHLHLVVYYILTYKIVVDKKKCIRLAIETLENYLHRTVL